MTLKPKTILKDYNKGILKKEIAIKALITIIDNSENDIIREESIEILGVIGSDNISLFKILEDLLISDSNERIRILAFNLIRKFFPSKAIRPIKYAIQIESGDFLVSLIKSLEELEISTAKKFLIKKIKTFDKTYLNFLLNGSNLNYLDFFELKEIIFNYLMYVSVNSLYFHRHKIPLALDFYDLNLL